MIDIDWIDGASFSKPEDSRRAWHAALDFLEAEGVSETQFVTAEEQAEQALLGEAPWGRLALAWREAEQVANVAATQGWHDPSGGAVRIRARHRA